MKPPISGVEFNWRAKLLFRFGCAAMIALMVACAPKFAMTVLINMIDDQEVYFRNEVVPPFEKSSRGKIDVVGYAQMDSMEHELGRHAGMAGLIKVPFGKSAALIRNDKVLPLDAFLSASELDEFKSSYMLTSLGQANGKQYYVPRKFETRIMVFCKSKVDDALATWRHYKDTIGAAMKSINGYGLPANYLLEKDPNTWDYFDLFVLGWIWSRTPYGGAIEPRIAHRGKRYSGTSLRIVDRIFQCNGDSANVLRMRGDAVVDALHWEAVYAAADIYNRRMWEEGWSGVGVWEGFRQGRVFLSFMTQLDCFFIHGTGRDGLDGYLENEDDMHVAVMPAGCSAMLDKNGVIARHGRKSITTGGWWWGIPKNTPDPRQSYSLARHITSTRNQMQGCSRFGMIPVRKDILSDMSMMFGGGWITQVYEVSFKQLMHNKFTVVPSNPHFDAISQLYLDAWFDIVVGQNWSADKKTPDWNYIKDLLSDRYAPHATAMLKGNRP
ncbi:MAG: extracellular solute-binding protein [Chitinivibrionales bacterium]|nr:extracellular solute-binding protein [Chitinivibrionales bacterium]